MVKKLQILVLLVIGFSSCEKVEFLPIEEEPVFSAGLPFTQHDSVGFNAGDDLYYMFASHLEMEDKIIYSGLFGKEESCQSGCAENFSIQFHQKKSEEARLTKGSYDFYSVPRDGFKHNYSLITNDPNPLQNATWKVGSEELSGESISIDSDNDTAPEDGMRLIYNITDVLTVQFKRSILPQSVDCDISLEFSDTNEGLQIKVLTSSPFTQVSWSTGVISKSIIVNANIPTYTARVFAADGCATDIAINIADMNLVDGYNIGFNQKSFAFSTPDNTNNAVNISYTNEQGVFYTSSTIGQILPFKFEILEITDYEINELGDPTWQIKASFDCILFGNKGGTRRIKNGNAVFAVSH